MMLLERTKTMTEKRDIVCANIRFKLREKDLCYHEIDFPEFTEIRYSILHDGLYLFCVAQVSENLLRLRHFNDYWRVTNENEFAYFCLKKELELGYISFDRSTGTIFHEMNIPLFDSELLPSPEALASICGKAYECLCGSLLLQCGNLGRKYSCERLHSIYSEDPIIVEDEVVVPDLLALLDFGRKETLSGFTTCAEIGDAVIVSYTLELGDFKGHPLFWTLTGTASESLLRAQGAQPFNLFFWKGTKLYMKGEIVLNEVVELPTDKSIDLHVDRESGRVRLAGDDEWINLPFIYNT